MAVVKIVKRNTRCCSSCPWGGALWEGRCPSAAGMHSTGCGVCGITKVTVTFCCSLLGCQEYINSMFCVVFQSSLQVLWDLT